MSTGIRRRRGGSTSVRIGSENRSGISCADASCADDEEDDEKRLLKMNVMEEVFLMGMKNKEGHTSYWNECLSPCLRGCALIELALRHQIELEPPTRRKRTLLSRNVILKCEKPTGDVILDEVIKHIKETRPLQPVPIWVNRFSGACWNPILNHNYQLKNVRERLAKSLVEKGILQTRVDNYGVFNATNYPLRNPIAKHNLSKRVQNALLQHWNRDVHRLKKRDLCLLILAHYSDVLDNAFLSLSYENYELAKYHHQILLRLNFRAEAAKNVNLCDDVMWAVFETFSNR